MQSVRALSFGFSTVGVLQMILLRNLRRVLLYIRVLVYLTRVDAIAEFPLSMYCTCAKIALSHSDLR